MKGRNQAWFTLTCSKSDVYEIITQNNTAFVNSALQKTTIQKFDRRFKVLQMITSILFST